MFANEPLIMPVSQMMCLMTVISSTGLTCLYFLMRLCAFLYFSIFLCVRVCVLFGRSRRAWQLSALFIWTEVICPRGPQMASVVFVV